MSVKKVNSMSDLSPAASEDELDRLRQEDFKDTIQEFTCDNDQAIIGVQIALVEIFEKCSGEAKATVSEHQLSCAKDQAEIIWSWVIEQMATCHNFSRHFRCVTRNRLGG
jgi:hypothetical protein